MIGIISIFFASLTAIFAYLLKEPEFLSEIENENEKIRPRISNADTLKKMTQLHLVRGVRNYYKEVSTYKPAIVFVIVAIIVVGSILALVTYSQSSIVNNETITIFSSLVLLFILFIFMVSLYLYLFSLIIKKI